MSEGVEVRGEEEGCPPGKFEVVFIHTCTVWSGDDDCLRAHVRAFLAFVTMLLFFFSSTFFPAYPPVYRCRLWQPLSPLQRAFKAVQVSMTRSRLGQVTTKRHYDYAYCITAEVD